MKRPAIFFDRDNTLIVNDGYLGDPEGVRLVPGAADAIARARSLGFLVVTVSNQSGVARGMFTEDDVRRVNARMDEMLLAANRAAVIDRHEFCPYHPDAKVEAYRQDSDLRKPKPGMILRAAEKLAIDLQRSWLIGDAPRDIQAGQAAGLRTILFSDPSLPASPATEAESSIRPEVTVASLKQAIDYIESHRDLPPVSGGEGQARAAVAPAAAVSPASSPATAVTQAPASSASSAGSVDPAVVGRIEQQLAQINQELRRSREREHTDFSVTKLLAGIAQVLTLAALFFAYLNRGDAAITGNILLLALVFQTMTIALLIMSHQR